MKKCMINNSGFTLVEILITILISSMFFVLITTLTLSVQKLYQKIVIRNETQNEWIKVDNLFTKMINYANSNEYEWEITESSIYLDGTLLIEYSSDENKITYLSLSDQLTFLELDLQYITSIIFVQSDNLICITITDINNQIKNIMVHYFGGT